MGKLKSSLCRKVSLLTAPHCQLRVVGQGMKQIHLYMWYPLFQAQWDRCYQRNHQVINSEYTYNIQNQYIYQFLKVLQMGRLWNSFPVGPS